MNDQQWDGLDPARSRLRVLVARVGANLVRIEAGPLDQAFSSEIRILAQNWQDLVTALALGEEPQLRNCPHCRRGVLREATRCRYCMRPSPAAKNES
jgi:hypothetical protein